MRVQGAVPGSRVADGRAENLEAIFVLRGALFTSWISFGFAGLVLRASSPKGGAGARGGAILVAYAAVSSVVSSYLSLRN